jgi:spore coat polysaccharide biosynthesis protein SpsF (cytidylyltransferase family)
MLEHVIRRAKKAKKISKVYVLTTGNERDDEVARAAMSILDNLGQRPASQYVIRGYERSKVAFLEFVSALKDIRDEFFVRLTADNPMIDPCIIDDAVKAAKDNADWADIISTRHDIYHRGKEAYPPGYDVEVVNRAAFLYSACFPSSIEEYEHVSEPLYFIGGNVFHLPRPEGMHNIRLTVDTQGDFDHVRKVMEECGINAGWREIAARYKDHALT